MYRIANLHNFHAVEKTFHIFWNLLCDSNLTLVTLQGRQETIHMARQKLKPVCPSCWFGVDLIVLEDVEITTVLDENKLYLSFIFQLRLTDFLEVAGRG
jgi:hypothetical protein